MRRKRLGKKMRYADLSIKKIFRYLKYYFCIGSLFFLLSNAPVCAQESSGENHSFEKSQHALSGPVNLFRKYISPADGDRCSMHPSCSSYCMNAVEKHGFLKGWVMTCDRLLRCGRDESKHSPPVIRGGENLETFHCTQQ